MDDKTKARLKDSILHFLEDQTPHDTKFIKERCLGVGHTLSETVLLLNEIITYDNSLLEIGDYDKNRFYSKTEKSKVFLDKGGFVGIYNKQISREKKEKLLRYYTPIIISAISLVIATASYFGPSDNVTQDQLNKEVKTVQDSVERLRMDFKKENDELKERLYEAEMLIAVYEDGVR